MKIEVKVGSPEMARRIAKVLSPGFMRGLNQSLGENLLERTRDYLDQMSVTRHKTADRLGATHTGYLEKASGRTTLKEVTESSATVAIRNTAGLVRAYHDLEIAPTNGKKWLTIPLSRISYGKRVADLRETGHKVFRPGSARILAEATGEKEEFVDKNGRKRRRSKLRPLYALVKSVRISRDEGLMPTRKDILGWTVDRAQDYIEVAEAMI